MTIVRKLMMNEPQKFIAKFYLNSKTWQHYHHYVDAFMNEIRRQRHWRWKKIKKKQKDCEICCRCRVCGPVIQDKGVSFVIFIMINLSFSLVFVSTRVFTLERDDSCTYIVWCRNLICDIIYYDCVYLNCVCQSNQSEVYDESSEIVFIVTSTLR